MRLAQAARKFSITTEDIVDFLEIRGIAIEKDSNTKLNEEAIVLLHKFFEVEENDEVELVVVEEVEHVTTAEDIELISEVEDDLEGEIELERVEDAANEKQEEVELEMQNESEEEEQIAIEEVIEVKETDTKSFKTVEELKESADDESDNEFVIKAPKVELRGLNVLGKIELPEPKPKPEAEQKEDTVAKSKRANPNLKDRRGNRKNTKRELSPAEIRKREEQREIRKRKQIELEKKRKGENFYKKNILKPQQLEQKKKPTKQKALTAEKTLAQKPQPKTTLGKFWRWLNT